MVRVFISYSHKDKEAVERLAEGLRAHDIDPWFDEWEVGPGDSFIEKMNDGLDQSEGGVVVFSKASEKSGWRDEEANYLTFARREEGKVLIPVVVGDDVKLPPLLRPIVRRRITEVRAIADGLKGRKKAPGTPLSRDETIAKRVLISLLRGEDQPEDDPAFTVKVLIEGSEKASERIPGLPGVLVDRVNRFLTGFRAGLRRSPEVAERQAQEANMAELGRELGKVCLPAEAAEALADLVETSQKQLGVTIEVCFESDHPLLLGLPFEALRLPNDVLLTMEPAVTMLRRPAGMKPIEYTPLAGPLKILVAVGAPDEERTASAVLDLERELHNILDAVEPARRDDNAEVRILEVGHPDVIGASIERDAYHVLHVSCHGMPGVLELEDEEGRAVRVTAEELVAPIRHAKKPLPMVFLNSCHGGVTAGQTASMAEALLRQGVPCVLAMQASVSDVYATQLARRFYHHLSRQETLLPSRALAEARKDVEKERLKAVERGAALHEVQPEYATPALYVAGEEPKLADFGLDKVPLRDRPVYEMTGPVPQLGIDDLIGRRKILRETLRVLRTAPGGKKGVVLTGIGGVGKSAAAGRAMRRMAEGDWKIAAVKGRFDLGAIATAMGGALLDSADAKARQYAGFLFNGQLDDVARLQLVNRVLAELPLMLVLDDFEQNLTSGGGAFQDAAIAQYLGLLAQNCRRGRLLITCRYPVPGAGAYLEHVPIGPLTTAQTRKLLLRLPALKERETKELAQVFRRIGGHPRMLEFLDGLLRGGEGRLPHVTEKLNKVLVESGVEGPAEDLGDSLQQTLLLGARDVFLDELLGIAEAEGHAEALYQAAVSNLPVSPAGLAHMMAGEPADAAPLQAAFSRLAGLSLVYRFPEGEGWVHRWTAEWLAGRDEAAFRERCTWAGDYRVWQLQNEQGGWLALYEAIRNYLEGRHFDAATGWACEALQIHHSQNQSVQIAALGTEVLEKIPVEHYETIAHFEIDAHTALGFTDFALQRLKDLSKIQEFNFEKNLNKIVNLRNLGRTYDRLGDLHVVKGDGDAARSYFQQALSIAEELVKEKPEESDYQRVLSVSYNKMGDLYRGLGEGEKAREAYQNSHTILERLASWEPDCADYQRDLSVSYERMGDLYRGLGEGEKAREAYQNSLSIAERLASREPDRADYQRDLSVSYERMGDLYRALGEGEKAREAYQNSHTILERLASREPDRADYQRDLSVSYWRMGGLGGPEALSYYKKSHTLLTSMKKRGTLQPVDEPYIAQLEELIRGAGG